MLPLVLAIETLVSLNALGLIRYETIATRFASESTRTGAQGCAVLGLGDSLMKYGFDPARIEERLGMKAYNLAAPGSPTAVSDALLKRTLDQGARPSVVLVGHLGLDGDPRERALELAEVLSPAECVELGWECRDPELVASLLTAELLPSLRYRYGVRSLGRSKVLQDRSGSECPGRGAARAIMRSWAKNGGAELRAAGYQKRSLAEEQRRLSIFTTAWEANPVYERHVSRLVVRAQAHGARVFWVVPPLHPSTQALRDAHGHTGRDTTNLRGLLDRIPGLVVLDARRAGYPASSFFDSVHLNKVGAESFSKALADAVGAEMRENPPALALDSSARWRELAPDARMIERVATGSGRAETGGRQGQAPLGISR
jgi:hypothetical protein